jgi:hypothetical protein
MSIHLRCTFEMEIDVVFEAPTAAENFFVHGDWKETFYALDDLDAVAKCLSRGFHGEEDRWDNLAGKFYRMVEGFGRFYRQDDGETYKSEDETTDMIGGAILVKYEMELDTTGTHEV